MRKIVLTFVLIIMTASAAAADTIYLRDGRTVQGTVLGFVNGRFAVRITGQVSGTARTQQGQNTSQLPQTFDVGQIVFFRFRDIERIEIEGRSLDEARYMTNNVEVTLGPNWVDSGVDVRRGQRVQVTASGTIYAGRSRITPGGLRSTDPNAPLPRAAEGVLIGSIGTDPNAPIIEIGLNREFVADRDGRLYLTINRSEYTDARGAFQAQVKTENDFMQRSANNRSDNYDRDDNDPFGTGRTSEPAPVRPRQTGGQGGYDNRGGFGTPADNRRPIDRTITVPGNSRGTDTGIDVRAGDSISFSASGNVTAGRRAGVVSPDGGRSTGFGAIVGTYPVPNAGVGALIGYVRLSSGQVSQPFLVGSQQTITVNGDGRLFLAINDDDFSDNSGAFNVRVTVTPGNGMGTGTGTGYDNTSGNGVNVTVPGYSQGMDTGVDVRAGQTLNVSASGTVNVGGTNGTVSPDGQSQGQYISGFPVPDAGLGALVGYIRTRDGRRTQTFAIGSQRSFQAPADGRLFLLVNDNNYSDNSGSFNVRIEY